MRWPSGLSFTVSYVIELLIEGLHCTATCIINSVPKVSTHSSYMKKNAMKVRKCRGTSDIYRIREAQSAHMSRCIPKSFRSGGRHFKHHFTGIVLNPK